MNWKHWTAIVAVVVAFGIGNGWLGMLKKSPAKNTEAREDVASNAADQAKDLERALRAYDSESSKGWPAGDRDLVVNMIYKVESTVPEGNLHLVVLRLQDDRVRMFLISDELTVGKWYKASSQRRLLPFNGD